MYDILLSDMSEKEQMEALNTPYRKKKPKARVNEKSLTDVTKNASAEVSVSDEKEKEEEEEEGQEGQEEEEPTVVTYRSVLTRIRYSRSRITTKTMKRRLFRFQRSNGCFLGSREDFRRRRFSDVLPSPMFKFHAGTEVRAMVVSKSKRVLYPAGADKCSHV